MAKRSATIIGAGLVGSLWALLLRNLGYSVNVFEKRGDPRKGKGASGRSINLVITSRGLFGLECAGVLEAALKLTVPVYGRMMHAKKGETQFQPYGQSDEFNLSISRSDLNNFLIDQAEKMGAEFFFDHELKEIDFKKNLLKWENGKLAGKPYDLLFGTDGAGSIVRRELLRAFPEDFIETVEWLEADYKELVLPAGTGNQYLIQKNALHIWPRRTHMLMALANRDGSFTMTLYLPKKGNLSFETVRTAAEVKGMFQSEFSDAFQLIPDAAEQFLNHPQGALGTVRCSRWVYKEEVVLMGDAAHAIVPFFGQGMNCGFEDCTELLRFLDSNKGAWEKALPQYDLERRKNANAIADMAIENWHEMRDKVADPQFLFQKKIESWLEKEFPQLFKSRYGMITYTQIPYQLAKEAGQIQKNILNELSLGVQTVEEISKDRAKKLIDEQFSPFLRSNGLTLKKKR